MKTEDRTTVITDASWCPDTGAGGWAAWVTVNRGDEVFRIKESGPFKKRPPSAHYAEVWALRNGIYIARRDGAGDILAQSDCTGALGVLRILEPAVNFRHVKGHTSRGDARSWVNRWCDREARKHMRNQRQLLQQQ